jgi:hypothetical protein
MERAGVQMCRRPQGRPDAVGLCPLRARGTTNRCVRGPGQGLANVRVFLKFYLCNASVMRAILTPRTPKLHNNVN